MVTMLVIFYLYTNNDISDFPQNTYTSEDLFQIFSYLAWKTYNNLVLSFPKFFAQSHYCFPSIFIIKTVQILYAEEQTNWAPRD